MTTVEDKIDRITGDETTVTINTPATITSAVSGSPIIPRPMVPVSHAKYFARIPGDWSIPGKDDILERPIAEWKTNTPFSGRGVPLTITECIKKFCEAYSWYRDVNLEIYHIIFVMKPNWVEQRSDGKFTKLHYEIHSRYFDSFVKAAKFYLRFMTDVK